uniref:Uncharacterized protein n=1 Tax=Trichogramma kaykai TaxID=54128 RepID=A0ABD2XDE4_9HYME
MDYWTNNEDVDDSATDGTHDEDDIAACPLTRLHARSHRGISLGNLRNYGKHFQLQHLVKLHLIHCKVKTGGEKLKTLKSMREEVDWENIKERQSFFHKFRFLTVGWKDNLPNLHDLFEQEEIEWMLVECVKGETIIMNSITFIDFVLRTGYKNEPELDEDGKPLLCRTTPVHYAYEQWSPGDEQKQRRQQQQQLQ